MTTGLPTLTLTVPVDSKAPRLYDIGERLFSERYIRRETINEVLDRARQLLRTVGIEPLGGNLSVSGQRLRALEAGRDKWEFWHPTDRAHDAALAREWEVELYAAAL